MGVLARLFALFRSRPERTRQAPPPSTHTLTVRVHQPDGTAVDGATITVWWSGAAVLSLRSDAFGRAFFVNIPDTANPAVRVEKDGYETVQRGVGASPDETFMLASDVRVGAESGRLRSSGIVVLADGHEWNGVGVTAFPMTERWAFDRPAVYRYVDWMIAHKAGIARVLAMTHKGTCQGVGNFGPQDVGGEEAFIRLCVDLADYLASRRTRLDLQAFADMQTDGCKPGNPLSAIDQPRFFGKLSQALAGKWNVILGCGNQFGKNGFNPGALPRPSDLFCTRGSGLEDELPFLPPWDAAEFHPGRGEDFHRKYKSVYEMRIGETGEANGHQRVPGPIWFTEPIRIGEHSDGSATNNPARMWDFAAGCKAWGVSALYGHLETGRDLLLPGPQATATFDAMVDAFTRIPSRFMLGSYARGDGHGGNRALSAYHIDSRIDGQYHADGALRTYELTHGAESLLIVTDPEPQWTLRLQNNARVVQAFGYGHGRPDTVFVVAR